jgi:polysaccharide deacetylase 2 family uncharacterized protein YibQ
MASRKNFDTSPLQVGLTHAGIGTGAILLALSGGVAYVSTQGDPSSASPRQQISLFETRIETPPDLKARFSGDSLDEGLDTGLALDAAGNLPVDDLDAPATFEVSNSGAGFAAVSAQPSQVSIALPKAPLQGMAEPWQDGLLPRISADGRTPFNAYRRPFAGANGKPMIALTVGGLGLSRRDTTAAITELPPEVTLSFVPYSANLQEWVDMARKYGHEVMIELPMEPFDSSTNDTGPYTLLTTATPQQNTDKLNWLLSRATGFFAVTNYQGGKFITDRRVVESVTQTISERGLGFVQDINNTRSLFDEASLSYNVPFRAADRILDTQPMGDAIDRQLLHLEAIALERGSAMGSGYGFPVTIEQIKTWHESLSYKGYVLAPVSAVIEHQAQTKANSGRS